MGQQQLLLIILGIIVVGIAVLAGILIFKSNAVENKRDVVANETVNLGNMALQYYKKARLYGGGQYSFTGWTVPGDLVTTASGFYTAQVFADSVVILGTGNEVVTSGDSIRVRTVVTGNGINTYIVN